MANEYLDKSGVVYLINKIKTLLSGKVDAVSGKGLSANDYTSAEKDKLSGIADGATANIIDSALSGSSANAVQNQVLYAALASKAALNSPAFSGTPTAPTASSGTSSGQLATTQFVMDALSTAVAATDAMVYKGTLGTSGTIAALPTTYKVGWTYRVITAGTYAGNVCEVGDLITSIVARTGSGNADSDWTVAQTNINGAITSVSGTAPISVTGSGSSRQIVLNTSGVAAGTYKSVTVDAYGRVTGGSNPTTLSGYGITDAMKSTDMVAVTTSEIDAAFV